jgi:hypothetical protein
MIDEGQEEAPTPHSLDNFSDGKMISPPPDAKKITAQLYKALRERYCLPEWSLAFEVGTGVIEGDTGMHTWSSAPYRSADGIAISNYRRNNHEWHGFEVKASRSDWLTELKKGGKAEASMRWVDRWWLVTVPGVVHNDELPTNWGLLTLVDGTLRITKRATVIPRQPAPGWLLANFLNRFVATLESGKKPVGELRYEIQEQEREAARKEFAAHQRLLTEEKEKYEVMIDHLERATGLSRYQLTNDHGLDDFGKYFRRAAQMADWEDRVQQMGSSLHHLADRVKTEIQTLIDQETTKKVDGKPTEGNTGKEEG